MQFKKVGEHTIRCTISEAEMLQRGIELDDFIGNRDKMEDFLREVVEEAHFELGMGPAGNAFSVQMTVLPEGDVCLLITEDKAEYVKHAIEEFKECLQQLRQERKEEKKEDSTEESKEEEKNKANAYSSYAKEPIWTKLDSLAQCIDLAKQLERFDGIDSELYKHQESFLFRFDIHKMEKEMAQVILGISEYAQQIMVEKNGGLYYLEHGTCILPKDAIEILAKL